MGSKTLFFMSILAFLFYLVLYLEFKNLHSSRSSPLRSLKKIFTRCKREKPLVVLLVSQPRSGSSLLGHLLDRHEQVVQFYEPLRAQEKIRGLNLRFMSSTDQRRANFDKDVTDFLLDVLNGEFRVTSRSLMEYYLSSGMPTFSTKWKNGELCGFWQHDRTGSREICHVLSTQTIQDIALHKFDVVLLKLIHFRLPQAAALDLLRELESRSCNVRIIYLQRHPVSSFWSLMKTRWISPSTSSSLFFNYIARRCNEMANELTQLSKAKSNNSWKEKILIVKYEDLLTEPVKIITQVFHFLRLPMKGLESRLKSWTSEVIYNQENCTSKSGMRKKYLGPQFVGEVLSVPNFPPELLHFIEYSCFKVFKTFGYNLSTYHKFHCL